MTLHPLNRQIIVTGLLLAVLALGVRALFVAYYPANSLAGGDPAAFWSFAEGVASGAGFRSTIEPWLADRPPLYAYFVGGLIRLLGAERENVFLAQAVLSAVSVMLFYWTAVRVLGRTRGLAAGILMVFFPHLVLFTKQILTEPLYIPLLVALLAALILPTSLERGWTWLLTGVIVGLLVLVRREALLPAALLTGGIGALRLKLRSTTSLKAGGTVLLAALLTVAPWLWRNYQVLGEPVLSSSSGINFMVGNNPLARGGYTPPPPEWQAQYSGLDELARDRKAWELSLQWVRENPPAFAQLLPAKLSYLWGKSGNLFLDAADVILIPFYLVGLYRLYRRRAGWQVTAVVTGALVLSNLFVGLVYVGGWRYRLAIYPALFLLAAFGIPERPVQWFENRVRRVRVRGAT